MKRIKAINLHKAYRVNGRLVERIASRVLAYCNVRRKVELEIIFLTDKLIRPINKKYKGADRPTDVLSFDLTVEGPGRARPILGEIFISIDKARRNSKIFNKSLEEEFTLYIIHAILHLIGYDDESSEDRPRMEAKQEKVLKFLCTKENLSKVLTPQ